MGGRAGIFSFLTLRTEYETGLYLPEVASSVDRLRGKCLQILVGWPDVLTTPRGPTGPANLSPQTVALRAGHQTRPKSPPLRERPTHSPRNYGGLR